MKKIVLASKSPRRKELLEKFIEFDIKGSNIVEKINFEEDPRVVSMALAYEKAIDVASNSDNGQLIISADTIVVIDNEILGKPSTRSDARFMLEKLSGRNHSVITGISIVEVATNNKLVDYEETHVKFRKLSDGLIERYLDTLEYKDKAGGYGIQGLGSILVEGIDGCYFNVMGLPIYKLDILLRQNFEMKLL